MSRPRRKTRLNAKIRALLAILLVPVASFSFLVMENVLPILVPSSPGEWLQDTILASTIQPESLQKNTAAMLKPLDSYLQSYRLPNITQCSPDFKTSPLLVNNSLSHLLRLDTPCSTGAEKCVISFSLFSPNHDETTTTTTPLRSKYADKLHYLPGWKSTYPGWEIRIYTDGSVQQLLEPYRNVANIVQVNETLLGNGTWGMMWRLLPIWDDTVDRFITRDIDSVPLVRDWATLYEWIRLNATSYRWGDHFRHYGFPIMGGALGLTRHAFSPFQRETLCQAWLGANRNAKHNDDQFWYKDHLWPLLNDSILSFDILNCHNYSNPRPFPVPHTACDHMMGGQDPFRSLRIPADPECRHPNHSDWLWG